MIAFMHYTFLFYILHWVCEFFNTEYPFFCNYLINISEIYTDHRGVLLYILIQTSSLTQKKFIYLKTLTN